MPVTFCSQLFERSDVQYEHTVRAYVSDPFLGDLLPRSFLFTVFGLIEHAAGYRCVCVDMTHFIVGTACILSGAGSM